MPLDEPLQPSTMLRFDLTLDELNLLIALADPAFRTVALITKMRQQAMQQAQERQGNVSDR